MPDDFIDKLEQARRARREQEEQALSHRRRAEELHEEQRRRSAIDEANRQRDNMAAAQQAASQIEPRLRNVLQILPGRTDLIIEAHNGEVRFTIMWGEKFGPTPDDERRCARYRRLRDRSFRVVWRSEPTVVLHDYYTVDIVIDPVSVQILGRSGLSLRCKTADFLSDADTFASILEKGLHEPQHHNEMCSPDPPFVSHRRESL